MSINFNANPYGNIPLADGSFVRLTQSAYSGTDCNGDAAWFAAGYLSTETPDEESGPTVMVCWESLGADGAENDARWDEPASIAHYAFGYLDPA